MAAVAQVTIDPRGRHVTLTDGVLSMQDFTLLTMRLTDDQEAGRRRLGQLLTKAHGCEECEEICDWCWDEATLLTLEAHGWTIERR